MATTKSRYTKMGAYYAIRERLVKRSLLGIVNWFEVESTKKLGTELYIDTTANEVYVNGKLVLATPPK